MIYNEIINYLYVILCFERAYDGLPPVCSANYSNLSPRNLVCTIDLTVNAESEIIRFCPILDFAILCAHQVDFLLNT